MATIINDNTVISSIKKKNNFCKNNETIVNEIFSEIINDLYTRYGTDKVSVTAYDISVELDTNVSLTDISDFVKLHFYGEYLDMYNHICKITMIKGNNSNVFNIERKK